MIVESILMGLTVMLIFFGLGIGYQMGKQTGDHRGYRRGFDEGVEFARGERRRERGTPVYSHLRPVDRA